MALPTLYDIMESLFTPAQLEKIGPTNRRRNRQILADVRRQDRKIRRADWRARWRVAHPTAHIMPVSKQTRTTLKQASISEWINRAVRSAKEA